MIRAHVGKWGKKARLSAAAVVTAATLAGCGMHPGAAAVVNGSEVSEGRVDDAAVALCSANITGAAAQGQQVPVLPLRGARQAALQLIVESKLAEQFAAEKGITVDQSQVSQFVEQNQQGIAALPEAQRQDFRDLLTGYRTAQLIFIAAGKESLASQGNPRASDDQAEAEGRKVFSAWAKDADVEVDPRFGDYTDGSLVPASGSLSIPVSASAKAGAAAEPSDAWKAGLPVSQRCSSPS
ncbi:SurA N-terminal domain-containing protein [Nocardioides mesophilus]|uniref:SurA N-terminal domain-containing protein n=1 Tax=Nocardioides mesophilus TaxID=433659 RepID=A0A7G9R7N0_9ACTN|nr:SurA N-terminal domain-containing protein [Nocardioides mesophilus]QNN51605.1 SurA N-terminal domain-containing protein [Nocardioides mesophilus]